MYKSSTLHSSPYFVITSLVFWASTLFIADTMFFIFFNDTLYALSVNTILKSMAAYFLLFAGLYHLLRNYSLNKFAIWLHLGIVLLLLSIFMYFNFQLLKSPNEMHVKMQEYKSAINGVIIAFIVFQILPIALLLKAFVGGKKK